MNLPTAPTARAPARTVLASSIASLLLAGLAHGVTWSGTQPLTLGVDPGGDDVDLLADTVVTLQGTGGTLLENVIFNASTGAVTTLTVNNAAGATRALAANATVLGVANARTLQIAGTADFRIGAVSDGGFANVQLVKNGGPGELILDNAANDLDGATLRVVDGTMSIFGFGGTASAVDTLISAIRIDGVNAKLRLGTLTAPGTIFRNNLAVNDSGTLEHTAASDDTLSGLVALASGKTLTANVTDGTLRLSGPLSRGANSGLTKTGAGTMVLSGFGTGTGVTNVNGGTLQYAMPGALYGGTTANWTAANINVASGATLAVNVGGASDFSTANVTTLLTQLSTVNNNGLKAGASIGFDTTNATATVSYSSALTNSTGTGGGNIGFKKLGTGTLSLSGTNTYVGPTTVLGGTLQFTKPGALYNGVTGNWAPANIIVNSGTTLALNVGGATDFTTGNATTLLSQISAVASNGLKAGATVAFDTTNAAGTVAYASPIADSIGAGGGAIHFTKLGTGTLSLDGVSTYSGATTASAGTLALGSGGSINNSSGISVGNGATYNVSAVAGYNLAQTLSAKGTGTANVTGAVNAGSRTLDLQDGSNTATLAFNSSLTLNGATLRFDLGVASSDRITIGGGITLGGTNIINVAPLTGASGLATGTRAYTLLTAGSGLVSSSFSLNTSVITIGATTYTLSLSGNATNQYLDVATGSTATPTTYTLTTLASVRNIRVGTGTSTITTTITNTGTTAAFSDSLSYTSLGAVVAPGPGVTLGAPGSGASVAPNAGGTANNSANQSFSSTVAGSYLITASGGAVTNTTLGGAPTLQGGVGTDTINVYRLAAPNTIGTSVTFAGNRRVGDIVAQQALTLNNTASADGFSERLDALILDTTGGVTGTGAVTLLLAGASNSSSLLVGLDTSTVGAKSGTVTVGLTSNGTATSLLGTTALAPQVITVNAGTVYRLAVNGVVDSPLVFSGNYRVGDVVAAQALVVSNDADADGFSENLDAVFTGSTGGAAGSGTVSLLAAGANNTTALLVGLNTSTVGAKSGTVTVGLTSNGAATSLLGTTALASQVITVSAGSVFRLASPNVIAGPVIFGGNYRLGDVVASQALSLSNTAAADGFSEKLDAAFSAVTGGATGTGAISLLAAGGTNGINLLVGVDTSTVGVKSGTVTVSLTSNGAGTSLLGTTVLSPQVITVNAGSVFRLAAAGPIGSPVTFIGNYHIGDIVAAQTLSLTNGAAADGFSEDLDAIVSGSTGGALGAGFISLLVPGATNAAALVVNLDTSTVGAKSGTVTVGLASNGAATSLLGTITLASQVITVNAGSVFRLAAPSGISSPVTFVGNYRLGNVVTPQALSLTNAAAADGFSESLDASFVGNTGGATGTGAISLLASGGTNATSLLVGLDTSTVGVKAGTVTVGFASNGAGTSLLGTTARPAQVITVNAGNVFRLAAPSAITSPLTFGGNYHVGDAVTPQALSLTNAATADGFSEKLDAAFTSVAGGATGAGAISLLGAGVSNSSSLFVSLNTSTVGSKSGSVTVGLTSNGAGTSLLGTTGLASQLITVNAGSVFRVAVPRAIDGPVTFGGNHHVGDVVPTQVLVVGNEAPGDIYSEELDVAFVGTTGGVTGVGFIVQLAASEDNDNSLFVGIDTTTAGPKSGTVTVGFSSNGIATSLLSPTALPSQVINVHAGSVFRLAAAGVIGSPVTLPNIHVGESFGTSALAINNTATNDGFSEGLNAVTASLTGDASATGGVTNVIGSSTGISVGLGNASSATAGVKTGTVEVVLTSNGSNSGLANTAVGSQTVTVSGAVYHLAAANVIGSSVNLGRVRVGGTFGTSALGITSTAAAGAFTEGLDAGFGGNTGAATHNGGSIANLAGGATNGTGLVVGLGGAANTGTPGAVTGAVTVDLVSNGTASGLANTSLTAQVINVSGFVYSGVAAWNVGSNGNWSTIANWQANGGVPGLDAGFAATDTATFGSGAASSDVAVSLAGVSPSVKALTFNNATHGYVINNTGGGTLKLDNGAGAATVTNSGGTHGIGSAVELASNTTVAVSGATDVLSLTGSITQSGSRSLTKTGAGTLNLSGTQGYDMLITSAGTTNIGGPLGATPGTATVVANATTRFGSVSQTLASLSIGAGATVTFSSGAPSLGGFGGKGSVAGGNGAGSAVVPEPSVLGLLLVGALGVCARRRRG